MKQGDRNHVCSIAYVFVRNTTVKSSPALLFPDRVHRMREVCVLWLCSAVRGGVLLKKHYTNTLSLVLAISKGLQTVTEITPASSPEIKLADF